MAKFPSSDARRSSGARQLPSCEEPALKGCLLVGIIKAGANPLAIWVNVVSIEGSIIPAGISKTLRVVKSPKLHDAVELTDGEVEDWICTDGAQNIGGFQAKVLRQRR